MSIKLARRINGLTQKQLGDLLGVHVSVVSKWERGVQDVPQKYHRPIHDHIGIWVADDQPSPFIKNVIASSLSSDAKVILFAMYVERDTDTNVCGLSFSMLAKATGLAEERVTELLPCIEQSGFIRPIGSNPVAKILK